MRSIIGIVYFLYTLSLSAQKYYSYSYDLGGDEFGHNIEMNKNKFIFNAYDYADTGFMVIQKILQVEIEDPKVYSFKEYSLAPYDFISSASQSLRVDPKGNLYLAGIKPISQPQKQQATVVRIKNNGQMDWNIDYSSIYPNSVIRSVSCINENRILLCIEEGIYNKQFYNRLIWIDSTGNVIKDKNLPNNGMKFNDYNYFYMLPDSGFLNVCTATPPPGVGSYTYWMHLRRLDKDGNQLWNTLDYMDYKGQVVASASPTSAGNFIGSKKKDAYYTDSLGNLINNPIVVGLFDKDGKKMEEELESPADSAYMLPNYMFPLKNSDVMLIGYSYFNGFPDLNPRGMIARISPTGKFKWWRYIYDKKLMINNQGGSLFDGLELENGDLAFSGTTFFNDNHDQSNIWLLKTDSMGCITPGCTGFNIVLEKETATNNINLDKELFFQVYPNPIGTETTVSFYNFKHRPNSKISLIDLEGKVLHEQVIENSVQNLNISMSGYNNGTYIIQYSSDGVVLQVEKIIKQ
ncbi:MAG TPA: T9SS type A sorting domain-containing protein [Saprospiraceae bacterium]|nr:T9SS type A sorting domain-containing protein [Saprospiraceae bacterium]